MDQAAVFLAASVLTAMGFIIWVIAVVVVNNIIAKYWKNLNWSMMDSLKMPPTRFAEPHELVPVKEVQEPKLDLSKNR
jgi:hypothetical protein